MILRATLVLVAVLYSFVLSAQTVSGTVKDAETKETLFGVAVVVKGTDNGTTTDFDGKFSFEAKQAPPFTIVLSYLGYELQEMEVTSADLNGNIKVELAPTALKVEAVEISANRISEKQLESPLTVESFNLAAIKETPAASFYDGLGSLKGVDLTTASVGCVVINTRGFNSTRPVRTLQLVNGADNQAPGLNFSLGNFVGSSELDIQKVDLIVGASSAMYGPNAFNGVIDMQTKNPFYPRGLSVMVKGGERNLFEGAVRYARKFQNKNERDIFAFKVNFSYLRADDWQADNYDATDQSVNDKDAWAGYDAVNVYGDERVFLQEVDPDRVGNPRSLPGLGIPYRTGYKEKDLVNYDVRNIKAGAALHFKPTEKIEVIGTYNFGTGTTVYQGDNRYSLKGLMFHQAILEVREEGKWFVRAYHTREDAGDSYDAVFTALLLQQASKENGLWQRAYTGYYQSNIVPKIYQLDDFPDPNSFIWVGDSRDSTIAVSKEVLEANSDSMYVWHSEARHYADSVVASASGTGNNAEFYEPGTERFDSLFNETVANTSFVEGGSRFYDKSSLSHVQAEYKFTPWWLDITLGGSFRYYTPDSRGTVFSDTAGTKITNWEFGFYLGLEKRFFQDKLILTATTRLDKNQNFDPVVSPAGSIVYKVNKNNSFRASFSSAIRNPTLQDQYLYYNVGRALLVGNIAGFDSLATLGSIIDYYSFTNRDTIVYDNIAPVRPEKVRTIEFGYKGTLFKRLFIDASYYYSWYRDFLGFRLGATTQFDETNSNYLVKSQIYRVSANAQSQVTTQGFSIGLTYGFAKYYAITGNYSWNKLNREGADDPIIPAFNTPEHKFNVGISGRNIEIAAKRFKLKGLGFNINYKWIQGYLFEGSPQFTGNIPTYALLDAQINYKVQKIYTTFKLGATNLLNNMQYQTYGGPRIGRLAYVSILFEFDKI